MSTIPLAFIFLFLCAGFSIAVHQFLIRFLAVGPWEFVIPFIGLLPALFLSRRMSRRHFAAYLALAALVNLWAAFFSIISGRI